MAKLIWMKLPWFNSGSFSLTCCHFYLSGFLPVLWGTYAAQRFFHTGRDQWTYRLIRSTALKTFRLHEYLLKYTRIKLHLVSIVVEVTVNARQYRSQKGHHPLFFFFLMSQDIRKTITTCCHYLLLSLSSSMKGKESSPKLYGAAPSKCMKKSIHFYPKKTKTI